jgi:hypothetical protein
MIFIVDMDVYLRYEQQLRTQFEATSPGVRDAIVKWLRNKNKKSLCEIFQIDHTSALRQDLIGFLMQEFEKGNIRPIHAGLSTTEYKSKDWIEPMADNLINRLVQYFETIRSQTERDITTSVPLEKD